MDFVDQKPKRMIGLGVSQSPMSGKDFVKGAIFSGVKLGCFAKLK